jgi:hypothetical protein
MTSSKYLSAFQAIEKEAPDSFELIGDFLLVEEIKDEEFTKSIKADDGSIKKLILTEDTSRRQVNSISSDKPTFVRVLLAGKGYYNDETKEDVPLSVQPGDIILVGGTAIRWFSVFGKLMNYGDTRIGLAQESSIQKRFKGQEGFDKFFDTLNRCLETSVGESKPQV